MTPEVLWTAREARDAAEACPGHRVDRLWEKQTQAEGYPGIRGLVLYGEQHLRKAWASDH